MNLNEASAKHRPAQMRTEVVWGALLDDAAGALAAAEGLRQVPPRSLAAEALATIEHAKLPPLTWLRVFDAKRDAWVREGSVLLMKAHHALMVLERAQGNPAMAMPPAQVAEARAKVQALAKELAQGDARGVRHQACEGLRQGSYLHILSVLALPAPPQVGCHDRRGWGEVKAAWWLDQSRDVEAVRVALHELGQTELLLQLDLGVGLASRALYEAKLRLEACQAAGDLEGGHQAMTQLGLDLVDLTQAPHAQDAVWRIVPMAVPHPFAKTR